MWLYPTVRRAVNRVGNDKQGLLRALSGGCFLPQSCQDRCRRGSNDLVADDERNLLAWLRQGSEG